MCVRRTISLRHVAVIEIQRVGLGPRWVGCRHVHGREVIELRLRLRPRGDGVSDRYEDVDDLVHCLHDKMVRASRRHFARQGDIGFVVGEPRGGLRSLEHLSLGCDGLLDFHRHFVDETSEVAALIWRDGAEASSRLGYQGRSADELGLDLVERNQARGSRHPLGGSAAQFVELGREVHAAGQISRGVHGNPSFLLARHPETRLILSGRNPDVEAPEASAPGVACVMLGVYAPFARAESPIKENANGNIFVSIAAQCIGTTPFVQAVGVGRQL